MGLCQSVTVDENVNKKNNMKISKNSTIKVNEFNIANTYKKKSIPKALKKLVWDKWVGENIGLTKCLCCKHQNIRQIEFHCGHIIAERNGGKTNVENMRPICAQCNLSMGTMDMIQFQKEYFAK
jgi:5-methylcytosine-specific restriction endonuclease McrA